MQIAYAIGEDEPVSLFVNTHQTGRVRDDLLEQAVLQVFDLTPAGIIEALDLCRPIYARTAAYGHFGKDGLPWEQTDRVEALQQAVVAQQGGHHA